MFDEFIAIDTETTVQAGQTPLVVEIGLVHVKNECVITKYSQLVNPGCPLCPATQKITDITQDQLDNSPAMSEIIPILQSIIGALPVIGHNLSYDLAALKASGLDLYSNPSADTMLIFQGLKPEEPHYGLLDVCNHLNIVHNQHHNALADAEATASCYLRLNACGATKWPSLRRSAIKALREKWDCEGLRDLSGLMIAVTGVPSSVPDKQDLEEIVTATGASLRSNVSGKINYLIVCDHLDDRTNGSLSGKHEKALELIEKGKPIRIISEKEFLIIAGFTEKTGEPS